MGHDRSGACDPSGMTSAESASPSRDERLAACLAMVGFWVCSVLGALLVLWWARRHGSLFARRYALVSLAFEAVLLALWTISVPVVIFVPTPTSTYAFLGLWLLQWPLVIGALALAYRAWRGTDPSDSFLPRPLVDRLPTS